MHPPICFLTSMSLMLVADGLTVHGPPAPLVAPLGSSVVLPCYVDRPLPVENLEVEWKRTDSEILVHLYQDGESQTEAQQQDYHDRAHFFTEEIQHGNFSLHLDDLTAEDEGQYTCRVHSREDSGETLVEIKDVERLLVFGSDESISASVGGDVTLNCSVDSHITPEHIEEVSWKKTDGDIMVLLFQKNEIFSDSSDEQYRDRVEFFTDEIPKGNFSLRLKSVRTEDKGVYMCLVFAGDLSANATVALQRMGFSVLHIIILILCISASGSALLLFCVIHHKSPTKGLFVQQIYDDLLPVGSSVVLPCHVDRDLLKKKLKVEWKRKNTLVHLYKDGDSPTEEQNEFYQNRANFFTEEIQHGNFSLRLDDLRAEDGGKYTCRVYSNQDCVFSSETKLAPSFKVKGSYLSSVPLGGSVVLRCQINKSLLEKSLKVEWRRTETLVHLYEGGKSRAEKQHKDYHCRAHFNKKEIKDGNFSLRLDKLRLEDAGKYTCTVYCDQDSVRSTETEVIISFKAEHVQQTLTPLGSSVVLPCYKDEPSSVEDLKVEWRRRDKTVHVYQDGASQTEKQHKDYNDRAHFFTEEIQHGNFSLRLNDLRAEDADEFTCAVYRNRRQVFSVKKKMIMRLLESVFRLQILLVFCPNILMLLAFVLWGFSEGSLNESISCSAMCCLRPLLLLWAAPYIKEFTGKVYTWILKYSYVGEYVFLSVVVFSALFVSAWQKLLSYGEFDRGVIIALFSVVFLSISSKVIYFLVAEVAKKTGKIIGIFDLVADMIFEILPTLQFVLLFYTFGSASGGFIIIIILPLLLMMTNERMFNICFFKFDCSISVTRTVMLIFTIVTNAGMIGFYIFTLENKTDPIGWACVIVFLQIFWMIMKFTDYGYMSRDFPRVVPVYVFGSVAVVLLNSITLMIELTLKTVTGDRTVKDLRFVVYPSESLFAVSLIISAFFPSQIAKFLQFCQNTVKCKNCPVRKSQQNTTEPEETENLNSGDQENNQPVSVETQK